MAAFFGSPELMADMPKGPLTDYLGGLSLKPGFALAVAPLVEQLEALGPERFAALSGPAQAQALQDAFPKAAKAVGAKILALDAAASAAEVDEAQLSAATEGLREIRRSFDAYAAAGGFTERLFDARARASVRLAREIRKRMDLEIRRLQDTLLGPQAGGETDAVVADLTEKALTRPMRRDEAVMELLEAMREGDPERRLAVLRALAAISAKMEREHRSDLAVELGKVLTGIKDARVLAAGHLLLGRLDPSWPMRTNSPAESGGALAKFGIHGYREARLLKRPVKIPAFTDGGGAYAFKVRNQSGGRGTLLGIGLRAGLTRIARVAVLVAAGFGVTAGSFALYRYDPLLADAIAALVIIAYLVFRSLAARVSSKGDATAGGRTPL